MFAAGRPKSSSQQNQIAKAKEVMMHGDLVSELRAQSSFHKKVEAQVLVIAHSTLHLFVCSAYYCRSLVCIY